ncbi:MAG: HIT family protein [archaeon]
MTADCIFCKIAAGEIPSKKFYEDDDCIGFLDINPMSKGHALLVTKQHYDSILDVPPEDAKELFAKAQMLSATLKQKLGAQLIYLMVMGDEIAHVHFHLIPFYGEKLFQTLGKDETDLDEVLKSIKALQ